MCNILSIWWHKMTNIWSCLARLSSCHHYLLVNWSKSINNYFTFNRLNWVYYNCYCSWIQHFLRLLSLYISSWKPRSKTWMRVIPSNTNLISTNLFHHIHKLCLINRVYWLNWNCSSNLRHWKNIHHCNGIVIMNITNHQTHNFKRNSRCTMLHHL